MNKHAKSRILPPLEPNEKYSIAFETSRNDNITLLPTVEGMDTKNVETRLTVDSEFITLERFFTFIKFTSLLILVFLGLNIIYLYNVNLLKNRRKLKTKEAFIKAFYDTLAMIVEFLTKLAEKITVLWKNFLKNLNEARKSIRKRR